MFQNFQGNISRFQMFLFMPEYSMDLLYTCGVNSILMVRLTNLFLTMDHHEGYIIMP